MKILAIDVGGTNVKILASGVKDSLRFPSGKEMIPAKMVADVKKLASPWNYDVVSIGIPTFVLQGVVIFEPRNLGPGWVGFDFGKAFGCPVKIMNDAAMQALGSYKEGKMLFLGLGTGLGAAFVINGVAEARELAHMPFKKKTFEEYVGVNALARLGKKRWRRNVEKVVDHLVKSLHPDDLVLGGGNAKKVDFSKLPKCCREGSNFNAFLGGFRIWG
jgi:polyphosphate glucokinase